MYRMLLEKLRIEFTKSRSRQSNDNTLAKSKKMLPWFAMPSAISISRRGMHH